MAQAKSLKFAQQSVLLGDGATPTEIFTAPCGFTELTMTVNIETNTTNVPDCADPDLPAWLASDEVSKQMTISGNGILDTDAMQEWRDWLMVGGEKNVRWMTQGTAANGGGYFQAPAIMTAYEETGARGQRWSLSTTLTLNGKPTFTAAA
ncbi:hypothetical protein HMSP1_38 [Sinorhizobium phage HMSP1-Susan]|nr:hypothetical protein HMSP1_38 [Sinorhizobium phage HMSP1-Susan]